MQNNIFFINFVYFFMETPYFSIFLLFFCRFFTHILCTLHNSPLFGNIKSISISIFPEYFL